MTSTPTQRNQSRIRRALARWDCFQWRDGGWRPISAAVYFDLRVVMKDRSAWEAWEGARICKVRKVNHG